MSTPDELKHALEQVHAEHLRVSRALERRSADGLARLAAQKERVAGLEAEHGELQERLSYHQRELVRLEDNPRPAITVETLARLAGVSFVITAAAFGLSSSGGSLAGVTAVLGLLAFMHGYFRG